MAIRKKAPIAKEKLESSSKYQDFGAFSGTISWDGAVPTGTPLPVSTNVARALLVNGAVTVIDLDGQSVLLPDMGIVRHDIQFIGLSATGRTATSVIVYW